MTQIHKHMRAEASLSASAELISKGHKKTRLQLGKTTSTAVFIAAHRINNPFERLFAAIAIKSNRFVKFKSDDQTFLINVKSASKRLHCSKEEIKDTKKSDYASWITLQAERTELSLKNYNKIYDKHFSSEKVSHNEPLVYKGEKTNLTSANLMNLVQTVITSKTSYHTNLTNNQKIVITPLKDGYISLKFVEELIAQGGRADIFALPNKCCLKYVFKIPRDHESASDIEKEAQSDSNMILNEFKIVKKLNQNGPQDGLLFDIHLIQPYATNRTEIGLKIPYYEKSDYRTVCKIPLASFDAIHMVKVLKEFEKLLHGLAHMHGMNIIHGDLKPDNIFLHKDRVDICDFGGASDLEAPNPCEEQLSPEYRYLNDDDLLLRLASGNKSCSSLLKAMDVFALGSIFHRRITQKLPWPLVKSNEDQFQGGTTRNPMAAGTPIYLKNFIHPMTTSNWENRPSAEKAYRFVKNERIKLEKQLSQ